MTQPLRLKIAIAHYAQTAPVLDGRLPIEGVVPEFSMIANLA